MLLYKQSVHKDEGNTIFIDYENVENFLCLFFEEGRHITFLPLFFKKFFPEIESCSFNQDLFMLNISFFSGKERKKIKHDKIFFAHTSVSRLSILDDGSTRLKLWRERKGSK